MGGSTFAVGYQGGALKSPSAVTGNGIELQRQYFDDQKPRRRHRQRGSSKRQCRSAGEQRHNQEQPVQRHGLPHDLPDRQRHRPRRRVQHLRRPEGQQLALRQHLQRQRCVDDPQQRVLQHAFRRGQHRRRAHREELLLWRRLPDGRACGRDLDAPHRVAADDPPELHRLPHAVRRRDSRHQCGRSRSCRCSAPINDVTVEDNVLLGGGYTIYAYNATYAASNITITNNDIGLGNWGYLYPGSQPANFSYTTTRTSPPVQRGSIGSGRQLRRRLHRPPRPPPSGTPSRPLTRSTGTECAGLHEGHGR